MSEPRAMRTGVRQMASRFGRRSSLVALGSVLTLAIVANLFAAKVDVRWDLTSDSRYTPGAPLRRALSQLPRPVTAVVFLGHGDPIAPTIEQLLQSYRNETRLLSIDWVDPDRDPVRYIAKQSELGIRVGKTEDGQVTTDAVLVLTAGTRKYYLAPDDVTGLDPEHSDGTATFEHAFGVGLLSLFRGKKPEVCFSMGHRELALTDQSPIGISLFKERLERDDLTARAIDLIDSDAKTIESCRLVVVASPDAPLSEQATRKLSDVIRDGTTNLLLLGGVVPDANGKLVSLGFEPLAQLGGIAMTPSVVIETDDNYRLPNLFGETFFASPAEHPITRALMRGEGDTKLRVVVALAEKLSPIAGGPARALLTSSRNSFAVPDVSQLSPDKYETSPTDLASHVVAMAGLVEHPNREPSRIVVMPTNLVQNRTFETPALVVTQSFSDSVVGWLTESSGETIEMVPRRSRSIGLELSEREMGELVRYVLIVMPSAEILMGLAVYLRRRRSGRRSEAAHDSGPSAV